MVWTRTDDSEPPQPQPRIAESTGGPWLSRPFAWLGDRNYDPDLTIYAGVTRVTWIRGWDNRIAVADNSGGTFHSTTFTATGSRPTVVASGNSVFLAWHAEAADRAVVAQLSAGTWTSTQVASPPSYPLPVLGQGGKARVVLWQSYSGFGALYIRTQV